MCQDNRISSLDVSKNTELNWLYCHGNNFSTQALDDIYCSLPDRTGNTDGVILPVYDSSSADHATVLATNKTNATAKNWKVRYYSGSADIPATTGTYTCPQLNMSRYITLTVKSGEAISLDFWATANVTPIRIVSGSNTQDIIVNDVWKGDAHYTADGTTMTVYGDLKKFYCPGNGEKITALDASNCPELEMLSCHGNRISSLDVSKNPKLTTLYCHGNNLSTQALDDIFCALPDRTGNTNGVIDPVYNSSSADIADVLATNAQNAIDKNWKVQYYNGAADIPATTGTYTCPQLNMSRYITLTVKNGEAIKLDFKAATAGTPIRIVSGSNTRDTTVGTDWTGIKYYTADGTTMTVYGDLKNFNCSGNGENITALDVLHSPELEMLISQGNRISSLDVSKNTLLTKLDCSDNNLSSLDISKNTQLDKLYCIGNKLSSLDISKNTQLTHINCSSNKLSSLGVSKNTKLKTLYCPGNNLSTAALDDIYCALPDRTGNDYGVVQPIRNSSSPDLATVLATNKQNAIAKNWKVLYYDNDTDIPATTGKHKCSATDIADAAAEPALTLYPNPVADVLYLSATARTIRIYDMYGIEVAHASDTDRIDVAHLPAGVYTVRADGTVAKMVKR